MFLLHSSSTSFPTRLLSTLPTPTPPLFSFSFLCSSFLPSFLHFSFFFFSFFFFCFLLLLLLSLSLLLLFFFLFYFFFLFFFFFYFFFFFFFFFFFSFMLSMLLSFFLTLILDNCCFLSIPQNNNEAMIFIPLTTRVARIVNFGCTIRISVCFLFNWTHL